MIHPIVAGCISIPDVFPCYFFWFTMHPILTMADRGMVGFNGTVVSSRAGERTTMRGRSSDGWRFADLQAGWTWWWLEFPWVFPEKWCGKPNPIFLGYYEISIFEWDNHEHLWDNPIWPTIFFYHQNQRWGTMGIFTTKNMVINHWFVFHVW